MAGESTCGNDALHGFFGTYPRGTARQAWLDLGDDPPKRRPPWASPRHNSLLRSAYTQNPGMGASPAVPHLDDDYPYVGPIRHAQTATGPRPGLPGWNARTATGPRTGPNWQHAIATEVGDRPGPDDVDCGQFFADLDDLQPLRDVPCINLGILDAPSDPGFGLLFYWLPDTTRTLTTLKLTMIEAYLPEFYYEVLDRDGAAGLTTQPGVLNEFLIRATNAPPTPGLFWDDSPEWNFDGYKTAGVSWAISLLRAYAGLAGKPIQTRDTCNYLAATFRQETEQPTFGFDIRYDKATYLSACDNVPSNSPLGVSQGVIDEDLLSDVWAGDVQAITPDVFGVGNTIYLCEQVLGHAAVADYYLHWAHRLFDYAETSAHVARFPVERDYIHKVGEFAARRGLAEVSALASTIVHEYGHLTGSTFHCAEAWLRHKDCCQWLLGETFQQRVMARLGLPRDLMGALWGFDFPSATLLRMEKFDSGCKLPKDPATDTHPPNVVARDSDLFRIDHEVQIDWTIPSGCATTASSGSFNG